MTKKRKANLINKNTKRTKLPTKLKAKIQEFHATVNAENHLDQINLAFTIGNLAFSLKVLGVAVTYYTKALNIYSNLSDSERDENDKYNVLIADIFYNLGKVYGEKNDKTNSIETFMQARDLYSDLANNFPDDKLKYDEFVKNCEDEINKYGNSQVQARSNDNEESESDCLTIDGIDFHERSEPPNQNDNVLTNITSARESGIEPQNSSPGFTRSHTFSLDTARNKSQNPPINLLELGFKQKQINRLLKITEKLSYQQIEAIHRSILKKLNTVDIDTLAKLKKERTKLDHVEGLDNSILKISVEGVGAEDVKEYIKSFLVSPEIHTGIDNGVAFVKGFGVLHFNRLFRLYFDRLPEHLKADAEPIMNNNPPITTAISIITNNSPPPNKEVAQSTTAQISLASNRQIFWNISTSTSNKELDEKDKNKNHHLETTQELDMENISIKELEIQYKKKIISEISNLIDEHIKLTRSNKKLLDGTMALSHVHPTETQLREMQEASLEKTYNHYLAMNKRLIQERSTLEERKKVLTAKFNLLHNKDANGFNSPLPMEAPRAETLLSNTN